VTKVGLRKCFNGHTTEHVGCVGCHHAFHVLEPGRIVEGRLVPPVVNGPNECEICHRSRHPKPVPTCSFCEIGFDESLEMAMRASAGARREMWGLRFLHWFVGWQASVAGLLAMLAGTTVWDWFQRADGTFDWFKAAIAFAAVPAAQWALKRAMARKQKLLPRLGPHGEILYGDSDPFEDD
jgi:hypothetical protein